MTEINYERCKACGRKITGDHSRLKGLCYHCDQGATLIGVDPQPEWKRCLRGHESYTLKKYCHSKDAIPGRDTCGQPLKVIDKELLEAVE